MSAQLSGNQPAQCEVVSPGYLTDRATHSAVTQPSNLSHAGVDTALTRQIIIAEAQGL